MENIRWYDQNPNLSEVFEIIQKLDTSVQSGVAQDIIQMLVSDFGLDLDKELNRIGKNYNYECKRWYDHNIDLFSSFEIIKNFSDELKNETVNKMLASIWHICLSQGVKND